MSSRSSCTAGRLEFAIPVPWVAMPRPTFGGEYLHPTIHLMAAALLSHITQNHPFIDGNKRTGANAATTFLLMNDCRPTFSEDALVELVLRVAQGQMSKDQIAAFFADNSEMV